MFSSSRLHIQLENKKSKPVFHLTVPPQKSGPLLPHVGFGGKQGAEARTSRKSLHLCSPLRRGNRASRGNRKPNRAIVRRIQAGRFCLWCLMNCKKKNKKYTLGYYIRESHFKVELNWGKPCELKLYDLADWMFPQHQLVSRKTYPSHAHPAWYFCRIYSISGPLGS